MKTLTAFLENTSKQFIFRLNVISIIVYVLFLTLSLVYAIIEKQELVEYLRDYFSNNITMVTEEQRLISMSEVLNSNFDIRIEEESRSDFCGPGNCYRISFTPLYIKLLLLSLVVITFLLLIRYYIFRMESKRTKILNKELSLLRKVLNMSDGELIAKDEMFLEIKDVLALIEKREASIRETMNVKNIAHDIRSPLAALDMGIKSLKGASASETQLIRSAINRIHDIANNLVGKTDGIGADSVLHSTLLPSLIANIVSEKRTEFRDKSNVDIDFSFSSSNYGLFSSVIPAELKRVISNLINNAVEAIDTEHGEVIITLESNNNLNHIVIRDNGHGIKPGELNHIFEEGFSFGKEDGTGVGLYHAKKVLNSWGGEIKVTSTVGKESIFTISLPTSLVPKEFVSSIDIPETCEVVIVDDDSSIHQVWRGRLQSLGLQDINISAFSSPTSFLNWIENNKNPNQVYLIDYEFLGSEVSGLEIVKAIDSKNTYLITSRFEEEHIQKACVKTLTPLVDKSMIGFIPINTEVHKKRVVFIDDDTVMHLGWEMEARNYSIDLHCFTSVANFIAVSSEFPKDSVVFVDSNLGGEVKGEVESEKIFKLGFKEIYLATGYSANDIVRPAWIKGIQGKKPEFDKLS